MGPGKRAFRRLAAASSPPCSFQDALSDHEHNDLNTEYLLTAKVAETLVGIYLGMVDKLLNLPRKI